VLVDAGTATAAPLVLANLRALGIDPRDVRRILTSHEHMDHAGGLAALQRATGAPVLASAVAARVLRTGEADADDPQHGLFEPMAPVAEVVEVTPGEDVVIGDLRFTPIAMPGHTKGGLGWQWRSCAGEDCLTINYADSMSAVSADDYRFTDHPDWVAMLRETITRVEAMPCDVLVTPHPSASDLWTRMGPGATAPLRDPGACRRYADAARRRIDNRLAEEARATGNTP
jgi:metallo-beta-lactamase class B